MTSFRGIADRLRTPASSPVAAPSWPPCSWACSCSRPPRSPPAPNSRSRSAMARLQTGEAGTYTLKVTNAGDCRHQRPDHPHRHPAGRHDAQRIDARGLLLMHGERDRRHPAELHENRSRSPRTKRTRCSSVLAPVCLGAWHRRPSSTRPSVSGGGAAAGVSVEDPTLVAAPYGDQILHLPHHRRSRSRLHPAGGHPFQNRTAFEFSSHPAMAPSRSRMKNSRTPPSPSSPASSATPPPPPAARSQTSETRS